MIIVVFVVVIAKTLMDKEMRKRARCNATGASICHVR